MPENLFRDLKKHPQRLFLYLLNVFAVHSGKVLLEIFSGQFASKNNANRPEKIKTVLPFTTYLL